MRGAALTHDSVFDDAARDLPRLEPGYRVGDKYVITQLLGIGANGAVYEATHEAIGHRVAIKIVHQALATRDDIIERFRREAKVCGTIRDRHVGQVYDFGQLSDGAPYMVMELLEGKPLLDLLKRKRLPIATVVDVGRQLLSGLVAAHAAGVVHRDVKPANLMLSRERSGEHLLKLVDFGISKRMVRDITERNVTVEGTVIGSPDYMPPEQLRGGEVDQRADLYAVGVVLYEAVTGRMPFDAPSMTELLAAILRDPVTPPSALRRDCPPALEQIILRAMSRPREERFESATAMLHALAQVVVTHQLPEGAKVWNVETFPDAFIPNTASDARGDQTVDQYTMETHRVRTLDMQAPTKKRGPLYAGVGALLLTGVAILWITGSDDETVATPLVDAPTPSIRATTTAAPLVTVPEDTRSEPIVALAPEPSPAPRATPVIEAEASPPLVVRDASRRAASRRAAEPASVDVSGLVTQASAAFVQGQLPKALALYREAVTAAPRHAVAWRGLGMTTMKMGRNNDARAAFERYLKLAPTAPDAERIRQKLTEL